MKVKIGNKIYDSNDEPIMLIMSNDEKELINKMEDQGTLSKFCSYPDNDDYKPEMIEDFMKDTADNVLLEKAWSERCCSCKSFTNICYREESKYYMQDISEPARTNCEKWRYRF
jgi:hypothetical protein